eukprot:15200505-Alexandrium_andersonii.AAC.1
MPALGPREVPCAVAGGHGARDDGEQDLDGLRGVVLDCPPRHRRGAGAEGPVGALPLNQGLVGHL